MLITLYHSFSVRNPEGRIRLYCKGADTVLLERLHPCNQELMNITSDHLNVSKHTTSQLLHQDRDGAVVPSSGSTLQSSFSIFGSASTRTDEWI